MGVVRVFHKYLEGALMPFHESSQKDSYVSVLCFMGVLGRFHQKRFTFVCRSQGRYQCKLNWTETP